MSSTSNGFLFKNCYGYCSILGNNLQGSSHRLKAVGGAYDKGRDLFMKNWLADYRQVLENPTNYGNLIWTKYTAKSNG